MENSKKGTERHLECSFVSILVYLSRVAPLGITPSVSAGSQVYIHPCTNQSEKTASSTLGELWPP